MVHTIPMARHGAAEMTCLNFHLQVCDECGEYFNKESETDGLQTDIHIDSGYKD